MIYVAIVCKLEHDGFSKRPLGDWASFIDRNQSQAVKRALEAVKKWGGGYRILVGRLEQEFVNASESKPAEWPPTTTYPPKPHYTGPPPEILDDSDIPF